MNDRRLLAALLLIGTVADSKIGFHQSVGASKGFWFPFPISK